MSSIDADHLVVGGGIVGTAVAARLAGRGAKVAVLDHVGDEEPASVRTAGWVNDRAQVPDAYHALRTLGRLTLLEAQGRSPVAWYRSAGSLEWTADGVAEVINTSAVDEAESLAQSAARLAAAGQDAYLVTPDEAARLDPALDPAALTGPVLYVASDGWVDLPLLVETLREGVGAAGGVVDRREVVALVRDGDRVVGVETADGGRIEAGSVVVAAGAGTPALLATAGVDVPQDTSTGVTLVTEPLANPPRTVLRTPWGSARADRSGRLVVVAAPLEAGLRPDRTVPDEVVAGILAGLSGALAGRPELRAQRVLVGRRPIPGGGLPVAGAVASRPGLSVAFTHSGATVGLLLGRLVADELLDGTRSPLLAEFRPERYGV